LLLLKTFVAVNGLLSAYVPLRNYSLTYLLTHLVPQLHERFQPKKIHCQCCFSTVVAFVDKIYYSTCMHDYFYLNKQCSQLLP